jgi:hypothetical protein
MPTPYRVLSFAPFRLVSVRRAAALVATAAALGLTACGDDDDDDGPTGGGGIAGTYTLRSLTIGGATDNTAPFTLVEGEVEGVDFLIEIKSGTLTLANGRYTGSSDFRTVVAGEVNEEDPPADAGAYTVSGNTITFNPDDADEENFTATVSGNTITATESQDFDDDPSTPDETVTFVFSK